MKGIVDYFGSNPEAIATLLVFFVGSLASILALLYALLARHPLVVRYLGNRSLVYIDPVLRTRIRASFQQDDAETKIHELRQIDFEILNSHPKNRVEERSITICLPTPDAHILGVTVANSDNRTPLLGGRSVTSTIQQIPFIPDDPLMGRMTTTTYPAVVLQIPYLEAVLQNDRVLVRITYDGSEVRPEVQGAKLESKARYELEQRRTVALIALVFLLPSLPLMILAYRIAGVPFINLIVLRQPPYLLGAVLALLAFLLLLVIASKEEWVLKWSRPLRSLLGRPPFDQGELSVLHYFDSIKDSHVSTGGG